jgi:16S rRNA (uracil1498-N3)-methyltransferase
VNLILLEPDELYGSVTRLTDRRLEHVREVHRAGAGDELAVGVVGGLCGRGRVLSISAGMCEIEVHLDTPPPAPLDVTILLAMPRPKVFGRLLGALTSLGVKRIVLMNSWRVEKSYWDTPKLQPDFMRRQMMLGLEQAKDTILPKITIARRFRPFVEDELPAMAAGTTAVVAHPTASGDCPRSLKGPVTLAVGPEGGFISNEIAMLQQAGFQAVSIGPRILRVETAVAVLLGRILP